MTDHRPTPRGANALVSVVIPAFDAAATIDDQLYALGHQADAGPYEVVVADNGSRDRTLAMVEAWARRDPRIRAVDASDRPGPAHARNRGARAARGDLLVFCDADDIVSSGWVAAMRRAWLAGADLIGGSLESDSLNAPEVVAWRGHLQSDSLPVGYRFLPYSVSANLGCDATVFAGLGGFEDAFPGAAGEDCDLCFRAQLAGFRLDFAEEAAVAYRHRHDLAGSLRQARAYGKASALLYRRYRAYGMYRPPLRRQARKLRRHLGRGTGLAAGKADRGRWLWQLIYMAARVEGAMAHRVLFW